MLANDSDADGDTLAITGVGTPAHGSAAANADGTITYIPAANYAGTDTVTYTVGDGHGGTATASVTVTIAAVNDPPVAVADSYTTSEDTALTIPSPGLRSNDSDVDGGSLTVALVQGPSRGTLTLNPYGGFTYTPSPNANGIDTFTYKVNDGAIDSAPAVVTITVQPVNDIPSAAGQSVVGSLNVPVPIVLAASDADGDTLTYQVITLPAHGMLSGPAPNLVYTPSAGYLGLDSFTFVVGDGEATSAPATVQIQVRGQNRAPEAEDQWMFVDEDTAVAVTLNAGDPEGDPLTFTIVVPPSHGTLSGTAPDLIYTPDPDYAGEDRFVFRASDGVGVSNDAAVDLWVWGINDAPVVHDLEFTTEPGVPVTGQFQGSDPEGDWIFFWVMSDPTYGTVTFDYYTGEFTYVPNPDNPGYDSFTYTIFDWETQGNTSTVVITTGSPPSQ